MSKLFTLEIYTPDRVFFKGEVESLIINTISGEMGILYHTLPIVTILNSGILKILHNNKWSEAYAGEGFVSVKKELVTLLASNAKWPYEVTNDDFSDEEYDENRKRKSLNEYKMAKAQLAIHFAKLKRK